MSVAEGVLFWAFVAFVGALFVGFVVIGAAAIFFAIRDEFRRISRER